MKKDMSYILFSIIRSVLDNSPMNDADKSLVTEDLVPSVMKAASKHDLAHLVAFGLRKNKLVPDALGRQCDQTVFQAVYRCESIQYELDRICATLEHAAIPFMPLKGSVIRQYYPEPWMRTSCDIDILIHEEDLDRAVDALVSALGYQADRMVHYHDLSLFSKTGVHLELHFSIKENMDNIDALLSNVWEYAYCEKDTCFHHGQTSEFFVFYHIAHMAHHFVRGGCGIKPFVDMYIIKNKLNYDETQVKKFCRKCGIEDFYDNVCYVTNVWFGDNHHTPVSLQIENYILKGGVYGSLENKVTLSQGVQGGKIRYALSRIFVPYDSLKNYYLILQKHKWLFPFMQVRRWFRLIFCGGWKRGVTEMKLNQNVSQSEVVSMGDFIKKIGL